MKGEPDVLVIGGGAVGICSAYYLAEQGLQVLVVEKGEIASGCSGANAGLIVPSYIIPLAKPGALSQGLKWMFKPGSPFYIKPRFDPFLFYWLWQFRKACKPQQMHHGLRILFDLNYASLELFDNLIKGESLICNYKKDGWLIIYKTERGLQEALEEACLLQSCDIKLNILDVDKTLEMEPALCPEITGGIFFPEDAHLDPAKFVKSLAERLQNRGVSIQVHTEVLEFETSRSCITTVQTTHGHFQPKQIVIAAGAWSPKLVQQFDLRLPVQPAKGYSISIKRPEACPGLPLYLSEANVAVTPLEDTLRFGGTMEFTGIDFNINSRRLDAIIRAAEDYLGQIENLDIIETWCGLRPCTHDGLPIIGRFPGYKNLIIATGHNMLGITQAPITGKLVSQLVCDQVPDVNLRPLAVTRFR